MVDEIEPAVAIFAGYRAALSVIEAFLAGTE